MTSSSPNGMPGMASMTDTLDFVKKLWGGMSVPGMVVPTMSVDELQQKITDLKTVESWLNLNLTMLRNTIQTMEIQRGTLATIQSMGAAMGAAMKPGDDGKPAFSFPFPGSGAITASVDSGSNPFAYPNWPAPAPKPGGGTGQRTAAAGDSSTGGVSGNAQASGAPAANGAAASEEGAAAGAGGAPDFAAAMAVPNAWWNMLQNQFMQAVGQAMADSPAAAPSPAPASPSVGSQGVGSGTADSAKSTRNTKTAGDATGGETKPGTRKPKA